MITIILVALAALAVGLGVGFLGGRRRAQRPVVDLVAELRAVHKANPSRASRANLLHARALAKIGGPHARLDK